MDLHQQIPQHSNELETRFVTLSAAFTAYGITTADLVLSQLNNTLIDVAKRTGRSLVEVNEYVTFLRRYMDEQIATGRDHHLNWDSSTIATGVAQLDSQLPGGGVPRGQITEVFGASGCGKSQMLLQIAIEAQRGESTKPRSIYVSTEAPVETRRLHEMISSRSEDENLSMDRIDCIYCDDLESQDHILFTQLPAQLASHPQGTYNLVIIDSIGHHARGGEDVSVTNESYLTAAIQAQQQQQQQQENDTVSAVFAKMQTMQRQQLQKFFKSTSEYDARISRKKYLIQLQRQLIDLAQKYNLAMVLANQVTDQPDNNAGGSQYQGNDDPLNFNFQLGQFSGWDLSTIHNFQQSFCDNQWQSDNVPMTYSELMQSLGSGGGNKRIKLSGDGQDHDPRYQQQYLQARVGEDYDAKQQHITRLHHAYNRETKKIIAALGYVWAKNIGCKILLVKNYRPLLKSKQSVVDNVQMVDPESGITRDELYRGFETGHSNSTHNNTYNNNPEDLIDGWQVERYAKVVSNSASTVNLHNQPMQGKISLQLTEAGFS